MDIRLQLQLSHPIATSVSIRQFKQFIDREELLITSDLDLPVVSLLAQTSRDCRIVKLNHPTPCDEMKYAHRLRLCIYFRETSSFKTCATLLLKIFSRPLRS
jgi:hypothetical protein